MRVATWNLAGRWSESHQELIAELDCDVLLMTEVSERVALDGFHLHMGQELMAPRRRWAAIASRTALTALPDPHPASAMAIIAGWTFCSSILPWRSCGSRHPWTGERHVDKTEATVKELRASLAGSTDRLVWGGDWNHALAGREYAGSISGRAHLVSAVTELGLQVPTAVLPHQIEGLLSIDHIAVPDGYAAHAERHAAVLHGRRLSDHDAYTVEIAVS